MANSIGYQWNPELSHDLGVATSLAALGAQIKDTGMRSQLVGLAQNIAAVHVKAIQEHTRSMAQ